MPTHSMATFLNEKVQTHPDGTKERWRDVPKYAGYYRVSDLGRVKSLSRLIRKWDGFRTIPTIILKLVANNYGYFTVKLCNGKTYVRKSVHSLVLSAFVSARPKGAQCRHLDGNPLNNRLENLCWGTPKENGEDRVRHRTTLRGDKTSWAKIKGKDVPIIHQLYSSGKTTKEISEIYGVSGQAIKLILKGLTHKNNQPTNKAIMRPSGFQVGNNAKGKLSLAARTKIMEKFTSGEMSYKELAKQFGVSYETIWSLINGRTYR